MGVATKYRVLTDFKFGGKQFRFGDSIDREFIMGIAPEKLGTLQRVKYIGLDPLTRPLDQMKKAELVDYGREVGAAVDQAMTKAVLVETIEEHLNG